ncbi:MAG: hypothetical protein JXR88_18520 [Clostridia bacterium]|nr:hypothetical protein [Clostridia bacterium]
MGRAYAFSNSLFHSAEALGSDLFSFSRVCDEEKKYTAEPKNIFSNSVNNADKKITWENELNEIHYGDIPEDLNFGDVSQDHIYIDSIINLDLWSKAGWKDDAYLEFQNLNILWYLHLYIQMQFARKYLISG